MTDLTTQGTIYAYAPDGAPILGTLERMSGRAEIGCFYRDDDGSLHYDHEGGTEEFYDGMETVTRNGRVVFLCENGNEWTFDQLVFKDEDGNAVEGKPGWNDCQPTHEDRREQAGRALLAALKKSRGSIAAALSVIESVKAWPMTAKALNRDLDDLDEAIAAAEAAGITEEG